MFKHIFSETIWPIELKFHMKSPYVSQHLYKLFWPPRPYMVKPFKYLLLWNQKDNDNWELVCSIGDAPMNILG